MNKSLKPEPPAARIVRLEDLRLPEVLLLSFDETKVTALLSDNSEVVIEFGSRDKMDAGLDAWCGRTRRGILAPPAMAVGESIARTA